MNYDNRFPLFLFLTQPIKRYYIKKYKKTII